MYKSSGLIQKSLVQTHGVQLLSVLYMLIDICLFTLCYAFSLMRECMISYLMSEI
jgi:hypothetical protein